MKEKIHSIYLRQHLHQPVKWHMWNEETLMMAKKEDKPLLVSIGFAACHWCHVMSEECFEDSYIAGLMNTHFICVKIDREERPDLDQVYMDAVQMIQQKGGWPLHAFCLPDGRPFFGGTYLPPKDLGNGIIPWPQLLIRISDFFKRNRQELEENADNIIKNIVYGSHLTFSDLGLVTTDGLRKSISMMMESYDEVHGGFGVAPKFPPCMIISCLLAAQKNPVFNDERITTIIQKTLKAMAYGGLHDVVGGGFFRYSVSKDWSSPHFEKMLYDNAQLVGLYSLAYRQYPEPLFKAVVEKTIGWLLGSMRSKSGLFYASMDADTIEGEGAYYYWTEEEIRSVLSKPDADSFCKNYGIEGKCLPIFQSDNFGEYILLKEVCGQLLAIRNGRVAPGVDNKHVVAWNSLAAIGLAHAAHTFGRPEWFDIACEVINVLWKNFSSRLGLPQIPTVFYMDEDNHLVGTSGETLSDYAYFAEACLVIEEYVSCFRQDLASTFLEKAQLTLKATQAFKDSHQPGYFFVPEHVTDIFVRKKEWLDNALYASNASLMSAFFKTYRLTLNSYYLSEYEALSEVYYGLSQNVPGSVAHGLETIIQHSLRD